VTGHQFTIYDPGFKGRQISRPHIGASAAVGVVHYNYVLPHTGTRIHQRLQIPLRCLSFTFELTSSGIQNSALVSLDGGIFSLCVRRCCRFAAAAYRLPMAGAAVLIT
jgi:hypothetical protein